MRFGVVGADKDSGADVEVVLTAKSREAAELEACKRGILVSNIKSVEEEESDMVPVVADDVDTSDGRQASHGSRASGLLSHPVIEEGFDTSHHHHGIEHNYGHAPHVTQYHVIMNQSLYLLEAAVMKHVMDGWEPQGGLSTGFSNNAVQFYQAMVKKK